MAIYMAEVFHHCVQIACYEKAACAPPVDGSSLAPCLPELPWDALPLSCNTVLSFQMVWATTNKVGCAVHTCRRINVWGDIWENAVYLVCNYSPK